MRKLGNRRLHVTPQQFSILQSEIAAAEAAGMTPDDAAAAALRAIGVRDEDIEAAKGYGFHVVVDPSMDGPPVITD